MRLAPVFYLVSILNFIFIYFYNPESLYFLTHLNVNTILFWFSNVFLLGYNYFYFQPLGPAWSLDIELQFYLLLPFLMLLMKNKINRVFYLIFSLSISLSLFIFSPDIFIFKSIIKYLVFFTIGVSIYKSKIKFNYVTEMSFNLLFFIVLMLHYAIPNLYNLIMTNNVYYFLFNIFSSFLLIPMLTNSVLRKSSSKDMFLGGMSYVLYLSHWMFTIPYNYYIKDISKIERIPYTIFYLLITYLFSFLVFKYFDTPIDSIRRKWVSSRN